MLALFTGQRGGDCVKMLWSHYDGRCIDVTQEKTGTKLKLPVHRDLKAHLDALPRPAAVILTTKTGQPWRLDHLRHQISKQCAGFGFPGYSLHGLRVCAAKKLAEAGCSPHEVGAVLGHKTLQMVEHYARDAEHLRLARSAFSKWEDNRR
jgi:integrase